MSNQLSKKHVWTAAGICVAATLALALSNGGIRAQEESPALTVGTYDPGQIAQQSGLQQKLTDDMSGIQQRMQQAQQAGDQEAMQALQGEARQLQQKAVADFEASIDQALPAVAEKAGVKLIAVEVAYAADDVQTKDITGDVVEEMGVAAPADPPELELPLPRQQ